MKILIASQTLIAGWDELECHRVFSFLCELTNLMQKAEAIITAKPGVCFSVWKCCLGQSRNGKALVEHSCSYL